RLIHDDDVRNSKSDTGRCLKLTEVTLGEDRRNEFNGLLCCRESAMALGQIGRFNATWHGSEAKDRTVPTMVRSINVLEELRYPIAKAYRLQRWLSGPDETSHRRPPRSFMAES